MAININDRTENNAASRAVAIAINRNRNFIYFPEGDGNIQAASQGLDRNGQDLESLFERCRNNEAESKAVASGRAVICNENINIVVSGE